MPGEIRTPATFASILGRSEDDPNNDRDYYSMFYPMMTGEQKAAYLKKYPEMKKQLDSLCQSTKRKKYE